MGGCKGYFWRKKIAHFRSWFELKKSCSEPPIFLHVAPPLFTWGSSDSHPPGQMKIGAKPSLKNNLFTTLLIAMCRLFGAQMDVTDIWRKLANFGFELVKIWQNLTKFDKVATQFSNSSFPAYNLDGSKFCQILSNFFWCLSNFYISLSNFSRCCQIPF